MHKKPFALICFLCLVSASTPLIFTACAAMGTITLNNTQSFSVNAAFTQGSQNLSVTLGPGKSETCSVIADSYAVTVTKVSDGSFFESWGYVYIGANTTQTLNL